MFQSYLVNRVLISGVDGLPTQSTVTASQLVALAGFPGTLGSVVFCGVGGALSQDNANFFWDNTGKQLGIGTITPDVYGLAAAVTNYHAFKITGANLNLDFQLIATTKPRIVFGSNTIRKGAISAILGSHLVFETNTTNAGTALTESMRLSNKGVLTVTDQILTGYVPVKQLPNVVNSNTVNTTTAETTFTGTGITLAIPANTLGVGDRIRVKFWGIYSRTSGMVTIRLKNNAVTMLATATLTLANVTDLGCMHEAIITILTIGAGGTVRANMSTLFDDNNPPDGDLIPSNGTHPLDTTILQTLSFSVQWSTSNVANSMTIENADWEILKAT